MKKQIIQGWQSLLLATITFIFMFGLFGAVAAQEKKSVGERYGSRDPRTCEDMKAPARGTITAALAAKYFICKAEGVQGPYLYLVEDVKVEVGGGRPYNPNMDLNVPEIDVKLPLYPIRGSLVKYQCYEENPGFTVSMPGKNCNKTIQPKATGYCYKTTFGDWNCYMLDLNPKNEDWFQGVAPPKGDKAAANKTAANDPPVETKNVNQPTDTKNTNPTPKEDDKTNADRDVNGFVKPDFSEMEKYFDIVRYEYNFSTRELTIVTKMKKANNPNAWLVEFFDADGARLKWGNTILHYTSGPDPQVGQVVKVYTGTPSEKQMRDEVKKIVITRKID